MANRNQLVDIAKGIGILLVVFGHNPLVLQSKGELFNVIFSFHMPLFFFLSGLFFKPEKSFKKTVTEKCDSLLKPYFVTLLFLGLVYSLFRGENFMVYVLKMLYGIGGTIRWEPLWFLTHLFAIIIFSWLLINGLGERIKTKQAQMILLALLLIIGVKTINYFWEIELTLFDKKYILFGLPFSVDLILVTTFYYLLGYFLSHYVFNFKPVVSVSCVSLVLFILCHYLFDQTIDLNSRIFNGFFVPVIESLCGIYIILTVSYYVQWQRLMSRVLSVFGMFSLFILIFHLFFQSKAFTFISKYLGGGHMVSAFLAFFVGSSMPVLMGYLIKKNDCLAIFYLPLKSNKLLCRIRFKLLKQMQNLN